MATPARGLGTYATVAEAAAAAAVALRAAIGVALTGVDDEEANAPAVVVGDALDAPGIRAGDDVVGVELAGSALSSGVIVSSRREQHTVRLMLTVYSVRITEDAGETEARAWGLLGLIDQHVRTTDPTLGNAVLWARVTGTDAGSAVKKTSDGYSGRASMVEATVECGVIAAVG